MHQLVNINKIGHIIVVVGPCFSTRKPLFFLSIWGETEKMTLTVTNNHFFLKATVPFIVLKSHFIYIASFCLLVNASTSVTVKCCTFLYGALLLQRSSHDITFPENGLCCSILQNKNNRTHCVR